MEVIKIENVKDLLDLLANLTDICKKEAPSDIKTEGKPVNFSYFIRLIARKKDCTPLEASQWLDDISEICPIAAFNIMAREIAVWLDKKYEDHIENSEKVFVISVFDGRIHEVSKNYIKNYRNFAAFRTIEDAKFACNIMSNVLKGMFKSNAKGK